MRISEAITLVGRGPLFEGESVQEGELSKDQLKLVQSIARATGWRRGGIWKSIHGLVVDFKAKKSMGPPPTGPLTSQGTCSGRWRP